LFFELSAKCTTLAILIQACRHHSARRHREVGVVAPAAPSERLDLAHVGDLTVAARNGVAVPRQIAKIDYAHGYPILWRITTLEGWTKHCST
jgi:hypothetical protein